VLFRSGVNIPSFIYFKYWTGETHRSIIIFQLKLYVAIKFNAIHIFKCCLLHAILSFAVSLLYIIIDL